MAREPESAPVASPPGAAAWRLRVVDRKGERAFDQALERPRYSLGRDAQCDLRLPAREVSREHATIERDEAGRWWLTDLGSTSGTFVNGRRIAGRVPFTPYDVAYVGEYRLELCTGGEPAPRPALVLPEGRARRAPARVRVYEGPLAGRDLRLDRGRVVFGEGPDATLPLEGPGYAGVRVVIRPLKEGDYEVIDESARPGLMVDGRPVASYRLGGGDVLLGLGPIERQRANALDAFGLRYLPTERPLDDDDDRLGPDDDAPFDGVDAHPEPSPPSPDAAPTPTVPPALVASILASQGPWPEIEFGAPAGRTGMAQTVEIRRPALGPKPDEAVVEEPPQTARQPSRPPAAAAAPAARSVRPAAPEGAAGRPFAPEGAMRPFAPEGAMRPFAPEGAAGAFAPEGAGRPFAPEGAMRPFAPEGAAGAFAPEGATRPFATEGVAGAFAPEGMGRPLAPEGAGRPFAPEGAAGAFGGAGAFAAAATTTDDAAGEPPPGPGYLGRTVVHTPRAQEPPASDAAPVSLTAFVRPLSSTPPSAVARPGVEDDEAPPTDPLAGAVKRTVRLSELNWPPQREALRARAEAGSRRWWLTAAALVIGVLAALALLLNNARRREPSPPAIADGALSVKPLTPAAPARPSGAPSAGAEAAHPSGSPAGEAPAVAPSAPRPARGPGLEGAGPKGEDAELQRKRRLQELCKQRLDCSP